MKLYTPSNAYQFHSRRKYLPQEYHYPIKSELLDILNDGTCVYPFNACLSPTTVSTSVYFYTSAEPLEWDYWISYSSDELTVMAFYIFIIIWLQILFRRILYPFSIFLFHLFPIEYISFHLSFKLVLPTTTTVYLFCFYFTKVCMVYIHFVVCLFIRLRFAFFYRFSYCQEETGITCTLS